MAWARGRDGEECDCSPRPTSRGGGGAARTIASVSASYVSPAAARVGRGTEIHWRRGTRVAICLVLWRSSDANANRCCSRDAFAACCFN